MIRCDPPGMGIGQSFVIRVEMSIKPAKASSPSEPPEERSAIPDVYY